MNSAEITADSSASSLEVSPKTAWRLKLFVGLALALCVAFSKPLIAWLLLGTGSQLYSCTLLIPLICVWLGWRLRRTLPLHCNSAPAMGVLLIALGCVTLSSVTWLRTGGNPPHPTDVLTLKIAALVLFTYGVAFQTLGLKVMRRLAFPAAFLIFMVPLPTPAVSGLEYFFQHTSAEVAAGFFKMTGLLIQHQGTQLRLPGVSIEVAQECSGIHSSYVLFLVGLVAGHLLLRRKVYLAMLMVFIVALGIVRNAFRVFVLGALASQYDPAVLDSWLHHQGGPLFFALSLIPLSLVLVWMRRRERWALQSQLPSAELVSPRVGKCREVMAELK